MHALLREAAAPVMTRRERFARLRERLLAGEVTCLRVVYFASAHEVYVTLSATPKASRTEPLDPDERLRALLLRLFLAWMSIAEPDWNDGPDAGGLIDWDLRANTFTHKHSGHRLQPFNRVRRG